MPHKLYRATLDREQFSADELAGSIDGYAKDLDRALSEAGATDVEIKVPLASDDQALLSVEAEGIDESRLDSVCRSVAAGGTIEISEVDDSSME